MPKKLYKPSQEEEEKKEQPALVNRNEGAAAWWMKDKNGNEFLSVKLPLGLHVNLFPNERD